MFSTPRPPVDVSRVLPEVAPLARTTVRLHPRPGKPAADENSMGGPLLWPASEPWPYCDGPRDYDHHAESPGEAAVPLAPVLQLFAEDFPELPFPAGTDVLQVLWCPFDHDPYSAPRPSVRWRRRADVVERLSSMPPPDPETDPERLPDPCVLHPERVVEYPSWDLPDEIRDAIGGRLGWIEQEFGCDYDQELSVASGTKVGGYPGWGQLPDWPVCACGSPMEHLLTVASWEFDGGGQKRWITEQDQPAMTGWHMLVPDDHPWRVIQNPPGLMLGDVGGIYLFTCTACPERPVDHRFDCA